ncbi:MAG: TonB-dependent receptor [Novosphingobium sp.]|nr:TonB-dependent receptor [Novosphingobium sp.]
MRTTVFRLNAALLASVGAFALASPALAQNAPLPADEATDETSLGEIIVQARKVNENLQDVPVAVTAFNEADLEKQNVQRAQDIANFTPGMAIRAGQSTPTAVTIALRGQVQTDILVTLDPSVGTYVDGVYWARAYGLNSNLLDIQSVQVLKGPQGTLFGRNTTGGALLINSNNPDLDDFTGRASFTYGRFNELEATGVLNLPIVRDRIALRVAAQRSTRDGYTRNVVPATATTALVGNTVVQRGPFLGSQNGKKFDERDRWNARAKLSIQPTDTLNLLFSGEYFDSDETAPSRNIRFAAFPYSANFGAANIAPSGAACTPFAATNSCRNTTYAVSGTGGLFVGIINGSPPPLPTDAPAVQGQKAGAAIVLGNSLLNAQAAALNAAPRTTANNEQPYATARTYTFGFTGTLDVPWGEAKLITGYRRIRTNAGLDLEGSQFPIHFTEGQQRIKQKSIELQTTGKAFDGAIDFAAGVFAFNEKGFDQSISITVPALNPTTSHFYGLIDNDSMGLYTQATWHITDQLNFTGGVRYSVDDKGLETRNNNYLRASGTTICSVVPVAPFVVATEIVGPAQCAFKRRDDFSGWSYTAGLDYQITPDVLVYAKTSKGFRSGGQNLRAPSVVSFIPFEPEVAYAYEVGAKTEFFDRRLRFNVAAYVTDVNDIQRSTLIATPPATPGGVPGTATILSNAGKAQFKGVEAELTALLFPGFTVSATGALVDPKYKRFSDLSGDRRQERFTGVAEEQYSLAADYSTVVGDDARVSLHVDYAWRSDVPTGEYFFPANPQNAQIVEATTAKALGLLGARASVEFGNFGLAVFGRNLTNERKYIQNLLVAPLGYITGIRQEPRTYGVTATAKF